MDDIFILSSVQRKIHGSCLLLGSSIHQLLRRPHLPLWLFCACCDTRRSSSFRCHTVCTLPSTSNGVSRTGYRYRTGCAHSDILGCAWSMPIPLRRTLLRAQLVCRGIQRYCLKFFALAHHALWVAPRVVAAFEDWRLPCYGPLSPDTHLGLCRVSATACLPHSRGYS